MKGAVSLLYEFCEHYLRADLEFVSKETGLHMDNDNLYLSLVFTCHTNVCTCIHEKKIAFSVFVLLQAKYSVLYV